MAEIHLYLRQYQPGRGWKAVVFFARPTIDPGLPPEFQPVDGVLIQRIYLDDLRQEAELSPGLSLVRLIIEPPKQAEARAREVIAQAQRIPDPNTRKQILELIQTVLLYKFPNKSRAEVEAMFGLNELKQTKVYQEALEEEALNYTARLLRRRLGTIPPNSQQQIEQLSRSQLEALGEDLMDFTSPADLSEWLHSPRG